MKKRKSFSPPDERQAAANPQLNSAPRIFGSPLLHLVLIIVAGVAVYANTFNSPFVLDDVTSIYGNPLVRDFKLMFKPRFIGDLTFAFNYRLGGMDVRGYHAINLVIHLLNGSVVYVLVSLLRRTPFLSRNGLRDDHCLIPLFTALLFVCHPVQTQAVTYISQRVASLATLFYVGTLVLWLLARQAVTRTTCLVLHAAALVTALLAMATKEMAATLPLAIILLEWVFLEGPLRRRLLPIMVFPLTVCLIPLAFLAAGKVGMLEQLQRMMTPTDTISRFEYLLTQFRVQATYLRLLLFPKGQNLDYDYPVFHSLFTPPVAGSLLLIIVMVSGGFFLLLRARRHGRSDMGTIGFGILWFYLTLSVESSLIPLQDVIFEHRLYLPSAGIFAAFVTALMVARQHLAQWKPAAGRIVVPVLTVIVFGAAVATAARNDVWRDEVTLWEDVVTKSPEKSRGHGSLGSAYQRRGLFEAAASEYERAIALDPRDPANYNNVGTVYYLQKKWQHAAAKYREAVKLNPANPKARYNLGTVLTELGKFQEAETELRAAIRLNPGYDEAHNSLGIVCARLLRNNEAVAEFKEAVRLNPGNKEAARNWEAINGALVAHR